MPTHEQMTAAVSAGIDYLRIALGQTPGLEQQSIDRFFLRYRKALEHQLRTALDMLLEPVTARLDRQWRGTWHLLNRETMWTELDKARRSNTSEWLLSRLAAHRPDLKTAAESWAQTNQVALPPSVALPRPIPGNSADALVIYDATDDELPDLPGVIPATDAGLVEFARLAYVNDDLLPGLLLDIVAGYFRHPEIVQQEPTQPADPIRLDQLRVAIRRNKPALSQQAASEQAGVALLARRRLLSLAGTAAPDVAAGVERTARPPVDRDHAPTPEQLLSSLQQEEDLRSPSDRALANIEAIRVLVRPSENQAENWLKLSRYSGWGGLSIESNRGLLPEAYVPDDSALIHEYYTPTKVALAVAELVKPWLPALPRQADGFVNALEPSAGIGRLLNAGSTPGFEQVSWTAVEMSEISSEVLRSLRPDVHVINSSFESFVQQHEVSIARKVGLVLSNPPYGERGASFTSDRNKTYRERKAYVYFLRRCLDLLAEGGVGVFIIPYGFLSGTGATFQNLREAVLKRHHLRAAFRLPSNLFPGASIVTDCAIFEARGGELPAVLPDDQYIVEGSYFRRNPGHVLGEEVGQAGDDDDASAKPRWGYEVRGDFSGFPSFEPRLRCLTCAVTPLAAPPPPRAVAARKEFSELPLHIQGAVTIGQRVKRYLGLLASGTHADIGIAAALQPELLEALEAWAKNVTGQPRNPWQEPALQLAAKSHESLVSFLSAFADDGRIIPQIKERPAWSPRYEGAKDDLLAQAAWLYAVKRELTTESLAQFRESLGNINIEPIPAQLIAGGWCFDDGKWLPESDYYSGLLWDRYYRAKLAADAGDQVAAKQQVRLAALIKPKRIEDIEPEPRFPWVPLPVLTSWLATWTGRTSAKLVRRDGLLQSPDYPYAEVAKRFGFGLLTAIGYINHDLQFFQPKYVKGVNPNTGVEENAAEALDRARLEYHIKAKKNFKEYIMGSPDLTSQVEAAYNKLFSGFVMPTYSSAPIQISRWTGRIKLKPHQAAGARRLIANNGGLLGFDVGVGKTYTGIATIAKLREEGRARRAIVIVPNTIIWKWHRDFRAALPDYRVLVVGSNRYIGRSGAYASRVDTPEERTLKWQQFQAGEYDVALVTFSAFPRTQIKQETLRDWVYDSPVILRRLSLDSRELAKKIEGGEDAIRKPRISDAAIEKVVGPERMKTLKAHERKEISEKLAKEKIEAQVLEIQRLQGIVAALSDLSERERAVYRQALDRWLAQRTESHLEPDKINFEDLGCDCLMVDEAQNFKNLWPVAAREGGIPKYLGAISEGAERSYALAIRSYLVRQRNGGSGVYLLSATPAKNSPLEYFTLLGYVDSLAWSKLGITNPEVFIDRYLRLEVRNIVSADMSLKKRSVVAGFKNLDEFRAAIFRYCEFRTAEEVGLVLPKREIERVTLAMDERQEAKYAAYAVQYRDALKRSKDDPKAKMKALGLLQRMALTAIHAELDEGPGRGRQNDEDDDDDDEGGNTGWTWKNASQVTDPSSPKLAHVVSSCMKRPDCGHLIFCDNVAVHRWITMLLVANGFPKERIAIFNADQAKDPAKRQQLAEKFNGADPIVGDDGVIEQEAIPPEYDIVIANATAYEGIDLHIRTCEVYHIDLPWEPATLQQRNGRAVRQGNKQSVILITYMLSDRSLDAIRLDMITGKLNWMKDVLDSAERETNNPAAQSELSGEEMVLFLARDPEEAKAAIAAQKALLEKEQFDRVRTQAWTAMRGLSTRLAVLERAQDIGEKQAVQDEIDSLITRIGQVPSQVWAWHFAIPLLVSGSVLVWGNDWVLPQNSFVWAAEETPTMEDQGLISPRRFATGRMGANGSLGIRLFGQPRFRGVSKEELGSWSIDSAMVEMGPSRWLKADDESQFRPALDALFKLETFTWQDIDPGLAPDDWRKYLVENYWDKYVEAILSLGKVIEFHIPLIVDGALRLIEPLELREHRELIPNIIKFTQAEWKGFVTSAEESGLRYSDLNETGHGWWGRAFPRGILRQKTDLSEISVLSPDGPVQVKPIQVIGSLAMITSIDHGPDSPGGAQYTITHIPSGRAVFRGYRSEGAAEAALRYATSIGFDWSEKNPNGNNLPRGFSSTLAFIRDSVEVPTEQAIRQYTLQV